MTDYDDDGPDLQPDEVRRLMRQVNGWACIRCGAAPALDNLMKPAGLLDGRQVFWCATDCRTITAASGPYGPYQDAIEKAISTKQCACEYVDIGVGNQRVTDDPECPVHSEAGEAIHYLTALIPVTKQLAQRGDAVEAWIKSKRDEYSPRTTSWYALDSLLDEYRLHADCGTPLNEETPDGAL